MPRPARRFAVALCFLLAYGGLAVADDAPSAPDIVPGAASAPPPTCPLGLLKCPKRPVDFSMCTKNDLLDTYVPGLPTDGDRAGVNATANANRVSSEDAKHYLFEGDAEIQRLDQFLRAETIR